MSKLYTASATATGGRNGRVKSSDDVLDLETRIPKEMGGPGGAFTNPEQLFAAGYSACFDSALQFVARTKKISLTSTAVTADVSISARPEGGFMLSVAMKVEIVGPERPIAEELLHAAHQVCPYSNATRNNVRVELVLV
jgi:Ohr subfamily peroxiredoxin